MNQEPPKDANAVICKFLNILEQEGVQCSEIT